MFQAGRFIAGLGVGNLVTICPMYLSEISPPQSRGFLVGHHAIFLVFGYMLSAWLGFACYFATDKNPSFAWRFPLSMQCFGPLVLFLSSIFITDSSRWLLQQGKAEEAWAVLKKLRSDPSDPDDLPIREELYQIKQQLALEQAKLQISGCGPWTAVIKKSSYRKRMIIGFLSQWGAEFGGPLVIVSRKA
jgi:MFS family permease